MASVEPAQESRVRGGPEHDDRVGRSAPRGSPVGSYHTTRRKSQKKITASAGWRFCGSVSACFSQKGCVSEPTSDTVAHAFLALCTGCLDFICVNESLIFHGSTLCTPEKRQLKKGDACVSWLAGSDILGMYTR